MTYWHQEKIHCPGIVPTIMIGTNNFCSFAILYFCFCTLPQQNVNQYMIRVQTFSVTSMGFKFFFCTNCLRITAILLESHISRGSKLIGQLTDKQFYSKVRPAPLLFHVKWSRHNIWSWVKVVSLYFYSSHCYVKYETQRDGSESERISKPKQTYHREMEGGRCITVKVETAFWMETESIYKKLQNTEYTQEH